jgi:hypothetical protein
MLTKGQLKLTYVNAASAAPQKNLLNKICTQCAGFYRQKSLIFVHKVALFQRLLKGRACKTRLCTKLS